VPETAQAAGSDRDRTLVLYSKLAFYPVHWRALEEIVRRYEARAVVLAAPAPELSTVHQAHGTADPARSEDLPIEVRRMPRGSRWKRLAWLAHELYDVSPDAIWVQEEPYDPFLLEILLLYRFSPSRPRIVTAVCDNLFFRPRFAEELAHRLLWPRLDGLMPVAAPSLEGIRLAGMPDSVPAGRLVAGGLEPEGEVEPLDLPFERGADHFVVGYAGNLTDQKGWKVLVRAIELLPPTCRLVVAGDGPQVDELRERLAAPSLAGRAFYLGLLPKKRLWGFYRALDCLVVPSVTTPRLKEQSPSVLFDGLAMGVPVVASASGGIPDVMGPAGILVQEDDPEALVEAIERLAADEGLRARLSAAGRERFRAEFAVPAYADKIAGVLGLQARSLASSR
jgi:glycosyltransferase involved in cell wall biosynthesis